MRIIKQGRLPQDPILYRGQCASCGTEFEFTWSESKPNPGISKDPNTRAVTCPYSGCGYVNYFVITPGGWQR